MKRWIACIGLLAVPLAAWAEEPKEEPKDRDSPYFATDRPDYVESSDVVGRGRFQIETSIAWERDRSDGGEERTWSTPTLLRLGVSQDVELRLETEGWQQRHTSEDGVSDTQSGTGDLSAGVKWHMADGEGAMPSLATLLHLDFPAGEHEFNGHGLRPSLRLVAEWEFADGWGLGLMPGVISNTDDAGDRFTGWSFGAVLGKEVTEGVRLFGEFAGEQFAAQRHGGNVMTFDLGAGWVFAPDMQLDFAMSRGLSDATPDWAATVGFSVRF